MITASKELQHNYASGVRHAGLSCLRLRYKRRAKNLVVSPFVVCKSRWVSADIVCGTEKANMREALNKLQNFAFGILLDSACISQYMIWILEMAVCGYSLPKLTIKSYGSFQELQCVIHLRILFVTKQRINNHGFEGGNVLNLKQDISTAAV